MDSEVKDAQALGCPHLARTPANLQRWWSTCASTYASFRLMEAHVLKTGRPYDLVVSHRADLVVPANLSYAGLSPSALTLLMKQNPRNLNFEATGFHDWWVGGPPAAVRLFAYLYKDLTWVFSAATPLRSRSIHTVFRNTVVAAGVDVECLCFRTVCKAYGVRVEGGGDRTIPKDGTRPEELKDNGGETNLKDDGEVVQYTTHVMGVQSQCRRRECNAMGCGTSVRAAEELVSVKIEVVGRAFPFAMVVDWLAYHHNVASVLNKSVILEDVSPSSSTSTPSPPTSVDHSDRRILGVTFDLLMDGPATPDAADSMQGVPCPRGLSNMAQCLHAWKGKGGGDAWLAFQSSLAPDRTVKILL